MTDYQAIKCTDYDQFEAYCIMRTKLKITLQNNQQLIGHAVDLLNIKNKGEFLVLAESTAEKGEQQVRLDMIKHVVTF